MDVAYNPHAERARRKTRSSTNINHLSLAPLTSKLPLRDAEALPDFIPSYIEGKSAPTTPRLIGHTAATPRSRSHHRTPSAPGGPLSKSKSASNLPKKSRSGTSTPRRRKDDSLLTAIRHENDSDWIMRTGTIVSSEAREFKGQAWLISRQSSTSLVAMRANEDDAFEQEILREREIILNSTRRGSSAFADDDASPMPSRHQSRFTSRRQSMADQNRSSALQTPLHHGHGDDYFSEAISGPDFVNLDEKLEELGGNTEQDDEAAIRQLVRDGQAGKGGSWVSNIIGFNLFNVEEHDDDDDSDDDDDEDEAKTGTQTPRVGDGITMLPANKVAPPKKNEGGWSDAAWLLSVASKVMF